MNESGYVIIGEAEGTSETPLFTREHLLQAALDWAKTHLECGGTKVTIVLEDRRIRDTRRESGLDPNVEIEGPPGWRTVKMT